MPKVKCTWNIDDSIKREVALMAAKSVFDGKKVSESEIVETAIREYLKKQERNNEKCQIRK